MKIHNLEGPLTKDKVKILKAGDTVIYSGILYTARDAAHKRLAALLAEGEALPFDLKNAVIYYVGPTPARPGCVIGSAGPTTSYRMDAYTPKLLESGLTGMIGKGFRSQEVADSIKKHCAVYLAALGGGAALISQSVKKAELVCYADLGTEAVRRLEVENFRLTVAADCYGGNIYESGPKEYLKANRI